MANRKIGFLPFIEDDQIARAKDNFRARIDSVNTQFKVANRSRCASQYVTLVKEAREVSEVLAESAALRGVHLPKIQEIVLTLFGEFVTDVLYICGSNRENKTAVKIEALESENYLKRQLSISYTHASREDVAYWIKASAMSNSKLAWNAFHHEPDFNTISREYFITIWREVFPGRRQGRPRKT
jgi:hypothetical protein